MHATLHDIVPTAETARALERLGNALVAAGWQPAGAGAPIRRWLSRREVSERIGLGNTAIYGMIAAGEFPRPVKIGGATRWVEAEVDAWMRAREEARS